MFAKMNQKVYKVIKQQLNTCSHEFKDVTAERKALISYIQEIALQGLFLNLASEVTTFRCSLSYFSDDV